MIKTKKAQEEIVGFSIIIILVAVILLVFLSFSMKNPKQATVESFEAESFLQALIQKTTSCRSTDNLENYTIKNLIFECSNTGKCLDNKETCDVLMKELGLVSNKSWNIGRDSPVKGYFLNLSINGAPFKSLGYGNQTRNAKGTVQELTREGKDYSLVFKAYY